jgi:hypothetical protein
MAIKITIAPRAKFRVKGSFNDENGRAEPFDFGLLCRRLDADELREKTAGEVNLIEFMLDVTDDWFDVKGAEDKPIAYSPDALRQLLKQPGLAWTTYRTFLAETGAKEKN